MMGRKTDSGLELEQFERALAIRRQLGDETGVPESLFHLGLVHQVLRGDCDVSIPLLREALSLVEPDDDVHLRGELHRRYVASAEEANRLVEAAAAERA